MITILLHVLICIVISAQRNNWKQFKIEGLLSDRFVNGLILSIKFGINYTCYVFDCELAVLAKMI